MDTPQTQNGFSWSGVFNVAPPNNKTLPGDKILLPQSALEQLLAASTVTVPVASRVDSHAFDPFNPYSLAAARVEQSQWHERQPQLPHPLTFRLINTKNGNVVHAGIREFSAEEGEVGLSAFLLEALGIEAPATPSKSSSVNSELGAADRPIVLMDEIEKPEAPRIVVHAKQLPKGTFVRLRPLEAGYDPSDWKSLLERHLRDSFTTLTKGETLTVRGSNSEEFRFLIDQLSPDGDGICVVDTDLEVDIEALDEEQARETLKQVMAKVNKTHGSSGGSSVGGDLDIWKPVSGRIVEGEYVDYKLPSWDREARLSIRLESESDLLLFISPLSARQRVKPREHEHVWGDFSSASVKTIGIAPSNVGLEGAEALYVSVHAQSHRESISTPHSYSLRVTSGFEDEYDAVTNGSPKAADTFANGAGQELCKNCRQWVPKRTMMLHENFCLRNNVLCPTVSRFSRRNRHNGKTIGTVLTIQKTATTRCQGRITKTISTPRANVKAAPTWRRISRTSLDIEPRVARES